MQVEFEEASICWLEQMSAKAEQVLFQKARPCACIFLFSGVDDEWLALWMQDAFVFEGTDF